MFTLSRFSDLTSLLHADRSSRYNFLRPTEHVEFDSTPNDKKHFDLVMKYIILFITKDWVIVADHAAIVDAGRIYGVFILCFNHRITKKAPLARMKSLKRRVPCTTRIGLAGFYWYKPFSPLCSKVKVSNS